MYLDQAELAVSAQLGKWAKEDNLTVCTVPASRERLVVIGGSMRVHEFPGVVCVVARILQPDRQVFIIPSF
jgi:hypothetical protein